MKLDKRRRNIKLLSAIIFLVALASCGETMSQTFMDEVNEARSEKARRNEGTIQIHDIAEKFVPIGTRKEAALEFCETIGFNIFPVSDKRHFDSKTYDESVICSKHSRKWYLFGKEEIRVIFNIKAGVVGRVKGYIFLTVL